VQIAGSTDWPPSLNATLTTLDEFPPDPEDEEAVVVLDPTVVVELPGDVTDEEFEAEVETDTVEEEDEDEEAEEEEERDEEPESEDAEDEEAVERVVEVEVDEAGGEDVEIAYAATPAMMITTIIIATTTPRPIAPRFAVGTYKEYRCLEDDYLAFT
jgi:hypothetical protein